ncbi:MAG: hypothetical protein LUH50_11015 [Bacteroides intestinalis]|nr:hypothetical protein [Bacteroides intestinalis]
MRKTIILLQLLIICITGYAQVIPMKYLGVENGLSNNYVVDFAQDRQGCVWIATEAGLNRFDGKNLKAYTTAGSDIVSDELNTLWFDNEENTLWIGTQRKGISLFNCTTQSFDRLTTDERLATNDVTHISAAADGGIWITHYHIGVEHYDKQTKQLTLYADNDIKGMKSFNSCSLDDGKGNLLIGHLLDGLSIVNLQTRTARNLQHDPQDPYSLPDNSVRCIYMDRFENIWIDTYNGLALFDPRTDRFITFRHDSRDPSSLGSNNINSIREMKDGTLWMSTDMAGISILNLSQFTFRDQQIRFRNIIASNDANGLSSANVKCIFQDSFENIWIGHHQQGINFISNSHQVFRTLPYGTGNAQGKTNTKPVWSMCIDNNRRIWVGGESELSLFQDDKLIKSIDMSLYLPNIHRYINAMKCDSKGYLWLGIYQGGVLKFNTETFRTESDLTDLLDNMSVRDFFEDTDGKMWISTEAGLYSYSDHTFRYEDKINNQLKDKVIFSFTRDRQGRIWVGTFGEGIHIFDPDGNLIEILSTSNGFCSNAINHLYVDSRGSIWVATRNGLVQMTDSTDCSEFAVYSTKNGIENPHIRAVQEDSNGDIWVSTNTGISCLNKSESKFDNFNY